MSSKYFHCPFCTKKYIEKQALYNHIENKHEENVTEDFPPSRLYFNYVNKKTTGSCVICGKETEWNETTERYNRFCSEKCKKKYVEEFQKRMIKVHGKTSSEMLKDPEQQKKMLANRKISGTYKWSDGSAKIQYTGSYEEDFLKFLDLFLHFDSQDVISPAPQVFYYNDNGTERFYIPDFYIPSINTLVEIKDGQDNKSQYENRLNRDAKKEKLKDDVMRNQKDYNYVKVVNKDYSIFLNFLMKLKNNEVDEKKEKTFKPIIDISEAYEIAKQGLNNQLLNETLETRLTRPFLGKEITLYHGSPIKLDIIDPLGPRIKNDSNNYTSGMNLGTRLSNPRYSTFWCSSDRFPKFFIFYQEFLRLVNEKFHINWEEAVKNEGIMKGNFLQEKFYLRKSEKNKYLPLLKKIVVFIHQVKVPTKIVGRGHHELHDEYTLDIAVKPDKVYKITWSDSYIQKVFNFIDDEEFEKLHIENEYINHQRPLKNGNFMDDLVYHSDKELKELKKQVKGYTKNESLDILSEAYEIAKQGLNNQLLNENYITNEEDIYYNKDKFDNGEINLCFITGHSGSGKTSMGRTMQSKKVEHIEMDDVINNDLFSDDNLKEYNNLIYNFFKQKPKYRLEKEVTSEELRKRFKFYERDITKEFVDYAISYCKSHKNESYAIDGIWVYLFVEPSKLKDCAVYIKGTSGLISAYRAAKRDYKNYYNKNIFKSLKRFQKDLKDLPDFEKRLNNYRRYFSSLM